MQTILQGGARVSSGSDGDESGFVATLIGTNAPCALIDAAGVVRQASPAFEAIFPAVNGTTLSDSFQTTTAAPGTPSASTGPARTIFGTYQKESGERVPAVLQMIPLGHERDGRTLIVVTDGAAFRKAEADRFESTPCPILRITVDGRITFANGEACDSFSFEPRDLIGQPLSMLFDASHESQLARKIAACVRELDAQSLDATTSNCRQKGGRAVYLVLTPDLAPDGQPLGALVVIESAIQTIRDEIRKIALESEPRAAAGEQDAQAAVATTTASAVPFWKKQFGDILEQIRKLIDFDHANLGVYANDITLFRAVAMWPGDSPKWPARWMDLPPFVPEWIASNETWIGDVKEFVKRDPGLLKSEVVRCYIEYGINSSLTLVVREGDTATSALTLCSKERGKYGRRELDILRELDLEPALLRYEEKIAAERQQFCASIKSILEEQGTLRAATVRIVNEIAVHFEWDYAAIFRVNRHRNRFELFYQKDSHEDFLMPANYQQRIGEGMLASTLEGDCVRIVDEIGAAGIEQYGYVGGNRGGSGHRTLKSAMTIPVHLNRRPRWVLNVECETSHAFRGPDEATLKEVVRSIEEGLMQRMLREMRDCLLKETDRGVVVVGTEGSIMELNETAAALLNRDESISAHESVLLSEFGADEHSREVLEGLTHTTKRRIELKGPNGRNKVVLATRVDLDSSFDTALWFLIDVEGVKWNQSLRFLRETVSDVAQQTRAPLALASLLARELPAMFGATRARSNSSGAKSSKAREISEELLAEIGKADLTFERLAEAVQIRKHPMRVEEQVDLRHCVTDVFDCLPERDRASIDSSLPDERVYVSGDGGRLTFVVRSIIAHLIRIRGDDTIRIEIALRDGGEKIKLKLRLKAEPAGASSHFPPPTDALMSASRQAREAASLSLRAIRKIVHAHGGSLAAKADCASEADGTVRWVSFSLSFPHA